MTTEDIIQRNVVRAVRLYYPKSIIFSVPNGGARSKATAAILKATGVLPGVSDLVLLHKGRAIFIEVKTELGRQSTSQWEFQRAIEAQGFPYWLVRSAAETLDLIDKITTK